MMKSVSCTSLSSLDNDPFSRRSVPLKPQIKLLASDTRHKRASTVSTSAFPAMVPTWYMSIDLLGQAMAQEIELESSLHVSAIQALPCEAEYGPLRVAPPSRAWEGEQGVEAAPAHAPGEFYSPASATTVLTRSAQATKSLAACLATPTEAADPPEREDAPHKTRAVHGRPASVPNLRYQPGMQAQPLQDMDRVESLDRLTNLVRRMRRRRRLQQIKDLLAMIPSPSSLGILRA